MKTNFTGSPKYGISVLDSNILTFKLVLNSIERKERQKIQTEKGKQRNSERRRTHLNITGRSQRQVLFFSAAGHTDLTGPGVSPPLPTVSRRPICIKSGDVLLRFSIFKIAAVHHLGFVWGVFGPPVKVTWWSFAVYAVVSIIKVSIFGAFGLKTANHLLNRGFGRI